MVKIVCANYEVRNLKSNNKHKATLILIVFTLGFLISYPFSKDNFWVGLISGACAASMIGGLADWFAVTAIFRKPLGIYWPRKIFRTDIIPKNREGIVKGLVDIIENDLLSKDNITKKVLDIKLYDMLREYVEEKSTNGDLHYIVKVLANDFYKGLDEETLKRLLDGSLELGLEGVDVSTFIAEFINFLRKNAYDDEIIDFSLDMFIGFIKHNKTHLFFTNFVENVIKEYENGSSSRAMTIKMLLNFVLKKSPSDIALLIENNIVEVIYEVKKADDINRAKIKNVIDAFSSNLCNNLELRNKIEDFKRANFDKVSLISQEVVNSFKVSKEKHDEFIETELGKKLDLVFQNSLNSILNNRNNNEKMDLVFKEMIISFVNKKHNTIGSIVRDRINQFSTNELVELIEGVAGNDLQMIRINGSVVGGFVGIITYLLTYWIR
jgi:uncharacterized membrane-anchored protein YjiN (DUF445 family)